ncbi:NTP transferase domain-containing protein [Isoptericola sp. 4D.3]|uniref:NTP transferase domain-containing protein n=1 Tax=Isoptericola peretonis TaxID=2918523 RepID=A0ABT0IYK6_9MICO|nr:NTP transferase domain-containing protein [Isoptericola sp. 4D.3]
MPATPPSSAPNPAVAVLLAAGAGRRLGRGPKALLDHRGHPLVEHVVGVLLDGGCGTVVVVLGAEAERVRAAAALDAPGVRVVVNAGWTAGMASSLRAGVSAALEARAGEAPACLVVAHVDQPGVTSDDVARLLGAHRAGRVTASRWAGAPQVDDVRPRWAHPLVLDAGLAGPAAASATGDAGARAFLRAHPELVDVVVHPGDGRDVDIEADLDLLT